MRGERARTVVLLGPILTFLLAAGCASPPGAIRAATVTPPAHDASALFSPSPSPPAAIAPSTLPATSSTSTPVPPCLTTTPPAPTRSPTPRIVAPPTASPDRIVAIIRVGATPSGIAVDTATDHIYVANSASNTLSVIDGRTNRVVATVGVGATPVGVAVNPRDSVTVIDGTTDSALGTISGFEGPFGIAVSPSTKQIYVANYARGSVSVVNGEDNRAVLEVHRRRRCVQRGSRSDDQAHLCHQQRSQRRRGDSGVGLESRSSPVGPGGIEPPTNRL